MNNGERTLPTGWASATLQDLVGADGLISDGDWIETRDQDPAGDVRLVQLADIGDGEYRDRSSRFLTMQRAADLGCTYLQEGDLLISRMADPIGRACLFPGDQKPCVTAVDVCIVRPGQQSVDSRWLMRTVNAPQFRQEIEAAASGTTRKRISRSRLAEISLPVPPLAEQRRIMAKLDELLASSHAARAALNAVPAMLEQYRQAILAAGFRGDLTVAWRADNTHVLGGNALLEQIDADLADVRRHRRTRDKAQVNPVDLPVLPDSWRWADAERCSRRLTVGHVGPMQTRYTAEGVPFLRSQNVRENCIDRAGLQFIPQDFHEELGKSALSPNDVVIVRSGAPGIAAVIPSDFPDANCADLVIARFSHLIAPELIVRFINSRQCRERIFERQVGVAQQHFNVGAMRTLPIPVMPLEEQEELLRILREHEAAIQVVRERTEFARQQLITLDAAVVAKAFRGELVPQDASDEPAATLLERLRSERAAAPRGRRHASPVETRA